MSRDYIARYGGQTTTCPCGAAVAVPVPLTLAYRAPVFPPEPAEGAFGDGDWVVVTPGARMPQRCWECNEPVVGQMWRLKLRWGVKAREKIVEVNIGYCHTHQPRRYWNYLTAGSCVLAVVLAMALTDIFASPSPGVSGAVPALLIGVESIPFLLFAVLIILRWRRTRRIGIVAFKSCGAWIKGFGTSYVRSLPGWVEARAAELESLASNFDQISEEGMEQDT